MIFIFQEMFNFSYLHFIADEEFIVVITYFKFFFIQLTIDLVVIPVYLIPKIIHYLLIA